MSAKRKQPISCVDAIRPPRRTNSPPAAPASVSSPSPAADSPQTDMAADNNSLKETVAGQPTAGETVEQFVTDLKLKAKTCAFGDMSDSMIRDRIVLGIASQRVRERLLREDNLNLANAIKICQAAEATQRQITTLGNDALDTHNSSVHYCKTKGRGQYKPRKQPNEAKRAATTNNTQKCGNCDTAHPPQKCGAYNKGCNNCGKLGHFSKVCRSPKISKGREATEGNKKEQ